MAPQVIPPLYTREILRLAASLPEPEPIERVDGEAEERSPTCGSRVTVAVALTADGKVEALRQEVHACAFGQASAALLAGNAVGRDVRQVETAVADLIRWLAGEQEHPGEWPALQALSPARPRTARHGAILLPFRALAAAMRSAQG